MHNTHPPLSKTISITVFNTTKKKLPSFEIIALKYPHPLDTIHRIDLHQQ